ncbi:unnamed protein product, partial [Aureobasidium pullulans]
TWLNTSYATCNQAHAKEIAHSMLLSLPREPLWSVSPARTKSSWSVISVERYTAARTAAGGYKIERKALEPHWQPNSPWSYINDDKKQDAPIVISDDEDDDFVIMSETHTRKCRRHVSVSDDQLIQAPTEETLSDLHLHRQDRGLNVLRKTTSGDRCLWVGCNAAFADDDQLYDHLDQQHIDAVGVRPKSQGVPLGRLHRRSPQGQGGDEKISPASCS